MSKSHIRTIDRCRDIVQTLIFGYLKNIFLITIVSCHLINYRNLMKLNNYLDNLTDNNVLKFQIRTIHRFRDIEQTFIFGKSDFFPKIIKIDEKLILHFLECHHTK